MTRKNKQRARQRLPRWEATQEHSAQRMTRQAANGRYLDMIMRHKGFTIEKRYTSKLWHVSRSGTVIYESKTLEKCFQFVDSLPIKKAIDYLT